MQTVKVPRLYRCAIVLQYNRAATKLCIKFESCFSVAIVNLAALLSVANLKLLTLRAFYSKMVNFFQRAFPIILD